MLYQTLSTDWRRDVSPDSFLVSIDVLVDDWWKPRSPASQPLKTGRPALLTDSRRSLTLAILAQLALASGSERDFLALRLGASRAPTSRASRSQSQLNRRIRALEPEMRLLDSRPSPESSPVLRPGPIV